MTIKLESMTYGPDGDDVIINLSIRVPAAGLFQDIQTIQGLMRKAKIILPPDKGLLVEGSLHE